jgi:outer membrane protein OmpA-like peptidoglycan-associated protein
LGLRYCSGLGEVAVTSAANAACGESKGSPAREKNKQNRRLARSRGLLLAAALAGLAAFLSGAALAQEGPVVVGGSGGPAVEVDMGAVSGGTYGPGGRRLLMPNAKSQQGPVVLRPPGAARAGALKPPSLKAPKKQAAAPAEAPAPAEVQAPPSEAAAPQLEPPPTPKIAIEPPPPPAKKVPPVETTALPPPEGAAKGAAPLEPPPPPPAPSAGKANGAPAAKAAKEAPAAEPPAPPPPPPPPEAKPANGHGAEAIAPAPPPEAKSKNGKSAETPPAPAEAKSKNGKPAETPAAAEGAPPPPPPAAESKPGEVAALPPPGQPVATQKPIAIGFAVGSAAIADQAKQTLADIAQTLNANSELRLQIVAYASGNEDNASQARRLSLSRALAVRSLLIDSGVRSTRMDVRALGNKFDAGPGDRVDMIVVKP